MNPSEDLCKRAGMIVHDNPEACGDAFANSLSSGADVAPYPGAAPLPPAPRTKSRHPARQARMVSKISPLISNPRFTKSPVV